MKRKIGIMLTALWLVLTTVTAGAQSSSNYDLTWSSIDGGGGESSGIGFTLISTIGQNEAGLLQGGSYTLSSGFLSGMNLSPATNYHVYLPLIMR